MNYLKQLETAVDIIKKLKNVELVAGSYNMGKAEILICIKFKKGGNNGTFTETHTKD